MNEDLKDHDVLVVKEKSSNELSVPNIDKNGELTTPPLKNNKNPDFLKIDGNENVLQSFFENFMRQVKDPTQFEFFKLPAWDLKDETKI